MALFLFTRKILAGEPIDVFNHGHHTRDFTYVDDIVEGVIRTLDRIPPATAHSTRCTRHRHPRRHRTGSTTSAITSPVELVRYIEVLEDCLGRKAIRNLLPLQPGDVPDTFADVEELTRDTGYAPATTIEDGVARFVDWYRAYYGA